MNPIIAKVDLIAILVHTSMFVCFINTDYERWKTRSLKKMSKDRGMMGQGYAIIMCEAMM